MNTSQATYNPGRAWLVMIVIMFCQVAFAISMFKVTSVMTPIMEAYGLDATGAGNLLNAVGIVSLILSLPGGMIMQKLGPRFVCFITLGFGIVGNIIGIMAPTYEVLLVSRVIEGFGYGALGVTTPFLISAWFPANKRGLPNGISSLWVPIGMLIILNSAGLVLPSLGFIGVWYIALVALVVMLILAIFFVKMPPAKHNMLVEDVVSEDQEGNAKNTGKISDGLKAVGIWMLLLCFLLFGYANSAYSSYYPTYLQEDFGVSLEESNFLSSIANIAMLAGGLVIGFIINKVSKPKRGILILVVVIVIAAASLAMFNMPNVGMVVPFMVILGFIFQLFPPTCFSVAPDVAKTPESLATSMGIITVGMNFSGVFGTLITSLFRDNFGTWQSITIPIAILAVIALIGAIGLLFVVKKRYSTASPQSA